MNKLFSHFLKTHLSCDASEELRAVVGIGYEVTFCHAGNIGRGPPVRIVVGGGDGLGLGCGGEERGGGRGGQGDGRDAAAEFHFYSLSSLAASLFFKGRVCILILLLSFSLSFFRL